MTIYNYIQATYKKAALLLKDRQSKPVIIGVTGVVAMYIAFAITLSVAWPWWSNWGDGPFHVDYAYQLYNGKIPDWDEGIQYPKFKEFVESPDSGYPSGFKHIAAPHPPLYYVLLMPVVGPLMNAGHWEAAFAASRIITTFIGVAVAVIIAYAASLLRIRERRQLIVLAPLFAMLLGPVVAISRDPQNDLLVTLFAGLMYILMYKLHTQGVSARKMAAFCAIGVLGMLSKATFIGILAPAYLLLAYVVIRKTPKLSKKRLAAYLAAPVVAVLVLSGWFYIDNFIQSGDFSRAGSQDWVSDRREPKTLIDVVTSLQFYNTFYSYLTVGETVLSRIITSIAMISGVFLLIKHKSKVRRLLRSNLPFILAVAGTCVMFILIQIKHAIPYGMYILRYFMPLLLPVSIVFAFVILRLPRLRQYWNFILALCMSASLLVYIATDAGRLPEGTITEAIQSALAQNGMPTWFFFVAALIWAIGFVMVVFSLAAMKRADVKKRRSKPKPPRYTNI